MADVLKKVPVREQDPKVRATNFEEVCLGYMRIRHCKNFSEVPVVSSTLHFKSGVRHPETS